MKIRLVLTAFGLTLLAPPLLGQALKGHDANSPVDVNADRLVVQDRQDRAVFEGHVKVRQEGLALNTDRLTIAYNKVGGASPQIDRLDAQGGVTVISADQTAHSDVAIYDLNRKLITMIGGVELRQGNNNLKGGRLLIDLVSGRSVIDGSSVGSASGTGESGGRVSGHFTVPQH
jgi:lipopolysaccharide export system protein LptA